VEKRSVEVELESRVFGQRVGADPDHANLVVALEVDLAESSSLRK
jgi:hypothetical protein